MGKSQIECRRHHRIASGTDDIETSFFCFAVAACRCARVDRGWWCRCSIQVWYDEWNFRQQLNTKRIFACASETNKTTRGSIQFTTINIQSKLRDLVSCRLMLDHHAADRRGMLWATTPESNGERYSGWIDLHIDRSGKC
jgi:hypothetical protein